MIVIFTKIGQIIKIGEYISRHSLVGIWPFNKADVQKGEKLKIGSEVKSYFF